MYDPKAIGESEELGRGGLQRSASIGKVRSTPKHDRHAIHAALRPVRHSLNTYPALFAAALEDHGVRATEMTFRPREFPPTADVIIIHWPDEFFFFQTIARTVRAVVLMAQLWLSRLWGQSLIWTVHNLEPHERGRPLRLLRSLFLHRVDGLIFLSEASRQLSYARFPKLRRKPYVIVPHGAYPQHIAASLPQLLDDRPAKLCFIGQVRRYKSPELLARTVAGLPPTCVRLVIAGACHEADLRTELESIQAPHVQLLLSPQSEAALESLIDENDAVVLPYRDIMNSGSVILALARARPVLAPKLGSLVEIQVEVGEEWLYLYEGELSAAVLTEFVEWLRVKPRTGMPDLSAQDWSEVGRRCTDFVTGLAKTSARNRRLA